MSGFYVSNFDTSISFEVNNQYKCVKRSVENDKYVIKSNTSKKFLDDKVFKELGNNVFIIEGVVLNKSELISKYSCSDWESALIKMRAQNEFYFNDFRGSFQGAYYDSNDDTWTFYTNHLGDRKIFYYCEDGKFIVSSDFNWITETLKNMKGGYKYNLDIDAVKSMLSYGWIYRDKTIISEVKKLKAGSFIKIKNGKIELIDKYYSFENTKYITHSEDKIINEIDSKFRHAVKLEYDKDKEYGYNHLAALSGGLDSRMNIWVAKDMGYENITAITFGQSQGDDIKVACQIASALNMAHFIKTLDDASFISDIPTVVKNTFGLIDVSGSIHGSSIMKLLDMSEFGLLHGGLIGDAIIASKWEHRKKSNKLIGANSKVALVSPEKEYKNDELYLLYERVANLTLGTQCKYFEDGSYSSPFLDIDFLDYCLKIPLKYRYNHNIYKKWILSKYPDAAKFIWEKTGNKINDSDFMIKFRKYKRDLERKVKNISKLNIGMNPYDYWYESNKEFRNKLNGMYSNLIKNNIIDNEMKKQIKKLYENGNCRYKVLVISVLQSINEYFK